MTGETLRQNKPYAFIPLTGKPDLSGEIARLSKADCYSGKLFFSLLTMTPLAIRSGFFIANNVAEEPTFILYRRNGKVVIPGSSVKGTIRSIFEALSSSCAPNPPGKNLQHLLDPANQKACDGESLCPACSVFGMAQENKAWKGKIRFSELKPQEGKNKLTEHRYVPALNAPFKDYPSPDKLIGCTYKPIKRASRNYGNERLYYASPEVFPGSDKFDYSKSVFLNAPKTADPQRKGRFYGRKFYLHNMNACGNNCRSNPGGSNVVKCEAIRAGQVFNGEIVFEGMTETEMAILLLSLGIGISQISGDDQPLYHKIGYGKPVYMGTVQIRDVRYQGLPARYAGLSRAADMQSLEKLVLWYFENASADVRQAIEAWIKMWTVQQGPAWSNNY